MKPILQKNKDKLQIALEEKQKREQILIKKTREHDEIFKKLQKAKDEKSMVLDRRMKELLRLEEVDSKAQKMDQENQVLREKLREL